MIFRRDLMFVTHREQFTKGNISINKVEGFFSLMQRGLIGQYHKLSLKYLPFYLSEFTFRYNNNLNSKSLDKAIEMSIVSNKCMLSISVNLPKRQFNLQNLRLLS
jgi:hypothetical protein